MFSCPSTLLQHLFRASTAIWYCCHCFSFYRAEHHGVTSACDNPGTLKSMSLSSSRVNKPDGCPLTGLSVLVWSASTFSSSSSLSSTNSTGIDTELWWMVVHSKVSPLSSSCFRDQTKHLFRSPEWTNLMVAHSRVSPFLIIGFLFFFDLVGVFTTSSNFWIQFFHPITF